MSFFQYGNRNIFYSESGSGAPLLLLHGNTASSNMFYEIAQRFEKQFRVILIDFLGHGQSDRLSEFPADLWFYEAQQVIAFLRERQYGKVNLIGTSGGALVAINVALETPELVSKVIADSFEGERAVKAFTEYLSVDRERSKHDEGAKMFYYYMHGEDWEPIVDNDTRAAIKHEKEIGRFFHKDLQTLEPDILLTGSRGDEFPGAADPNYFDKVYEEMLLKIGHGQIHLFQIGGHPAMLTSQAAFCQLSSEFLT